MFGMSVNLSVSLLVSLSVGVLVILSVGQSVGGTVGWSVALLVGPYVKESLKNITIVCLSVEFQVVCWSVGRPIRQNRV